MVEFGGVYVVVEVGEVCVGVVCMFGDDCFVGVLVDIFDCV